MTSLFIRLLLAGVLCLAELPYTAVVLLVLFAWVDNALLGDERSASEGYRNSRDTWRLMFDAACAREEKAYAKIKELLNDQAH